MNTGFVKRAWIRNPGAPIGQPAPGKINCPCDNAPESFYRPGPNIICQCGTVYTWEGWILDTKILRRAANQDIKIAMKEGSAIIAQTLRGTVSLEYVKDAGSFTLTQWGTLYPNYHEPETLADNASLEEIRTELMKLYEVIQS